MESIIEKFKSKNLKVTPQRLAIYRMLNETNTHPSAEAIHKALESSHPSLSLATVYKTLHTLKEAGFIQAFNVGLERYRYDANSLPHSHMICNNCHRVYDLFASQPLENLRNELQELTDFIIASEQVYIYGICKSCELKV